MASVHVGDKRWLSPQIERLDRHAGDYRLWASLDGVKPSGDPAICRNFALDKEGIAARLAAHLRHGPKLNELARRICEEAADDDWLLFLDGDAFPVAPIAPLLELDERLVAVLLD